MNTDTRTELKVLGKPDETRSFEKGKLDVFNAGGAVIGRARFEPGWKWSECVKPIAKTESCQAPHTGYQIKGTMHVVFDDGSSCDIKAGEAFYLPPGHDAWVVGQEAVEALDFTGMADYAKPKGGAEPVREGRKH